MAWWDLIKEALETLTPAGLNFAVLVMCELVTSNLNCSVKCTTLVNCSTIPTR